MFRSEGLWIIRKTLLVPRSSVLPLEAPTLRLVIAWQHPQDGGDYLTCWTFSDNITTAEQQG